MNAVPPSRIELCTSFTLNLCHTVNLSLIPNLCHAVNAVPLLYLCHALNAVAVPLLYLCHAVNAVPPLHRTSVTQWMLYLLYTVPLSRSECCSPRDCAYKAFSIPQQQPWAGTYSDADSIPSWEEFMPSKEPFCFDHPTKMAEECPCRKYSFLCFAVCYNQQYLLVVQLFQVISLFCFLQPVWALCDCDCIILLRILSFCYLHFWLCVGGWVCMFVTMGLVMRCMFVHHSQGVNSEPTCLQLVDNDHQLQGPRCVWGLLFA